MAIVLASQSPRRQELLARIGVEDFKTLSLDIDESYPEGLSPEDTVRYIAKKKCDAAAALCSPDDLIITADTMVFLGNDRLGKPRDEEDALRMLLNELLARSLEQGHTYALCRCEEEQTALQSALCQLGFTQAVRGIYYVDMRNPVMLLQDAMLCIKPPHKDAPAVQQAVRETRPRLRMALGAMFPGKLLLCFDTEMLNQAIAQRIEQMNGVQDVPPGVRRLGPYMCVPYGKIFADAIVPNTVTKTLHVEKCYAPDVRSFTIEEYPDYSPLPSQVRALRSFHRPIILVDDLLHKGYRMNEIDPILKSSGVVVADTVVGVQTGHSVGHGVQDGIAGDGGTGHCVDLGALCLHECFLKICCRIHCKGDGLLGGIHLYLGDGTVAEGHSDGDGVGAGLSGSVGAGGVDAGIAAGRGSLSAAGGKGTGSDAGHGSRRRGHHPLRIMLRCQRWGVREIFSMGFSFFFLSFQNVPLLFVKSLTLSDIYHTLESKAQVKLKQKKFTV